MKAKDNNEDEKQLDKLDQLHATHTRTNFY